MSDKQQESKEITVHELKCWPEYFQQVKTGAKNFELRLNDRDYKTGDILHLKEWNLKGYNSVSPNELVGEYTGDELRVKVKYIFHSAASAGYSFGLLGGYCIMAIELLDNQIGEASKMISEDIEVYVPVKAGEDSEFTYQNLDDDKDILRVRKVRLSELINQTKSHGKNTT
jgi:hypothetical protein